MPQPDHQYVRSCLNGSPGAFRHLVERHQIPLMRYLRGHLSNNDEAEEVAQEAFVRAYFGLHGLQKPEAFFPWLLGIADRVAKETVRAAKRRRQVDWERAKPTETASKEDACTDTAVTEAVAELPDRYREVVLLRFHGGQSCAEISRDLDVPLGTVTKRLSRAYAILRERLGTKRSGEESEVRR